MSSSTISASMSAEDCPRHRVTSAACRGYSAGHEEQTLKLARGMAGGTHRAVLLQQVGLANGRGAADLGVVIVTKGAEHSPCTLRAALRAPSLPHTSSRGEFIWG